MNNKTHRPAGGDPPRWVSLSRGFTLVELLVVVAIIAVLLAMLLPALEGARWTTRHALCKGNFRQIATAFTTYALDNRGYYPHPDTYVKDRQTKIEYPRPIVRVYEGFIGAVGNIFYPYLPAHKETKVEIERYGSNHKMSAEQHPLMRCPEAEAMFMFDRRRVTAKNATGKLIGYGGGQVHHFFPNCISGVDSGWVSTGGSKPENFYPTEPEKMLRKLNDTMVMRTDDGPVEYTILMSDRHRRAGHMVETWHGRTEFNVDRYGNRFYFFNGPVMPNFAFADGSVRDYTYHTADRNSLMYTSQGTQRPSGDGYLMPKDFAE